VEDGHLLNVWLTAFVDGHLASSRTVAITLFFYMIVRPQSMRRVLDDLRAIAFRGSSSARSAAACALVKAGSWV
jgi:hypothetical protein